MPLALALLAEPDVAVRQSFASTLIRVGYEVSEAGNALQLKLKLFSSTILLADDALLVLDQGLAGQCGPELAALTRVRSRVPSPAARVVLTGPPGWVPALDSLGADPRQILAVLEKPVEVHELERLVRRPLRAAM